MKKNVSVYRRGNEVCLLDINAKSANSDFALAVCGHSDIFTLEKGIRIAALRLFVNPKSFMDYSYNHLADDSNMEYLFSCTVTIKASDLFKYCYSLGLYSGIKAERNQTFGTGELDENAAYITKIRIELDPLVRF